MRLLTTEKERKIRMQQLRPVSKLEKIIFPISVLTVCAILLPSACSLIGALMFGNLAKECGVINRLSDTMQNALMNTVTIFLGLSVGSKMAADKFLNLETLGILLLGMIAFGVGTAGGVLLGKLMNKLDPKHPFLWPHVCQARSVRKRIPRTSSSCMQWARTYQALSALQLQQAF